MKTLRMYRGKLKWFTELGARIAENDLLNDIRAVLKEYQEHQNKSLLPKRKKGK